MPAIFTEAERTELAHTMVEAGWRLLVADGLKGLRVERVAEAAGIAKGTFYHFFPSKGAFLCAMVRENRGRAVDELARRRDAEGAPLGREAVRAWLLDLWGAPRNIFRILTPEEYGRVAASFPEGEAFDAAGDAPLARWLVDEVAAVRPGARWQVVSNLMRACAFTLLNRDLLIADSIEDTVEVLVEALLDELFGQA